MWYKFLRSLKRTLLIIFSCIVNRQTGLLLFLIGSFWLLGALYCWMFIDKQICFQWAFWHLFDLGEVRESLKQGNLMTKVVAGSLYVFTWVLGCGVLISILIDEKAQWLKNYNQGLRYRKVTQKNHVVIFGWDEFACSLISELLQSVMHRDEKTRKIIILSAESAEEIKKQLLQYQINVDCIPIDIEVWKTEFDSIEKIRLLRLHRAKEIYILGMPNKEEHDYRVLNFLDMLLKIIPENRRKDSSLPCYILINNYSNYWRLNRMHRSDQVKHLLQIIPVNYHENSCKHLWSALPDENGISYPHLFQKEKGERDTALVIVGFSAMGQTILIEALRVAHYGGNHKTVIQIIDPLADHLWNEFLIKHPGAETIHDFEVLPFIKGTVLSAGTIEHLAALQKEYQLTVVFSSHNTDVMISHAGCLKNCLGNDFNMLIRANSSVNNAQGSNNMISNLYEWKNVFFFGRRCDSSYNPWRRELLARNLHESYLGKLKNAIFKESRKEWKFLEEPYRWKYRYQIDALPEMLQSVGVNVELLSSDSEESPFGWTAAELQLLSEASHNRWWADRILEGWRYGKDYKKSEKIAPHMRPYSELSEEDRKIDFLFIQKIPGCLEKVGYCLKRMKK